LNNTWGLGQALNGLGDVARYQADPLSARQYFEESLALFREHGNKWSQAWAYSNLGYVECDLGNLERAATLHRQAIGLRLDLGDKAGLADSLEGFADLATARREAGRALRLFGAAEVLREQIGVKAAPVEVADLQSTHAAARAWLDSEQADAAWAEGRAMPLADALTLVLSQTATRSA
jgi:tetratricopeptide (TPR) repeat protein